MSTFSQHKGRLTERGMRYECPCCRNFTLAKARIGLYQLCEVCGWEDDPEQLQDHNLRDGANVPSLSEARVNYLRFGACDQSLLHDCREPHEYELP